MAAKDSQARKRIMEGEPKAPLSSPVRFTSGCTLVDLVIGRGPGMGSVSYPHLTLPTTPYVSVSVVPDYL